MTPGELEIELRSLREDLDQLQAERLGRIYNNHLYAIDDMAAELAGMTRIERNYFDHKGKNVPAVMIRLSDWWRKFRLRHGF